MSKLLDFIERQSDLWEDPQTVEHEVLSANETLVEWYIEELETITKLAREDNTRNIITELCVELINYGKDKSDLIHLLTYLGVQKEHMPDELLYDELIGDYDDSQL
jgi:hypothetical protein